MAKKRGLGYPGLSLPEAIERMRPVIKAEPHNEMISEAVAKHLGYKGLSGASLAMIADMRRYGLLEGRGDQVTVSREALSIITDEHSTDQKERAKALIACAINDSVFASINSNFKTTPQPQTLVPYLIKNGFNYGAANEVATNYIETMKFVNSQIKDYNPLDESNDKPPQDNDNKHRSPGMTDYKLPLSTDTYAILSGPFPLDEATWKQMLAVLDVMKPGLVSANKPAKKEEKTFGDIMK